jgi:hypothetical protein
MWTVWDTGPPWTGRQRGQHASPEQRLASDVGLGDSPREGKRSRGLRGTLPQASTAASVVEMD